jgi:cytidine deaminase
MAPSPITEAQQAELIAHATLAAEHSYSPYSRFRVGAALLLETGETITGCNVENCSYRLTSCAEQAAIARAVSQLGPHIRVRAIAVANLNNAASMPCGACRQTLAEFAPDETPIFYPADNGAPAHTTLGQLLPNAFRPSSLESR